MNPIEDFEIFAPAFLKIKSEKGDIIPFEFNTAQRKVLSKIKSKYKVNRITLELILRPDFVLRFIILKARQQGISTLVQAIIFWILYLVPNQKSLTMGHKTDASNNLFDMYNRYYKYLPKRLKRNLSKSNEKKVQYASTQSENKIDTAGAGEIGRSDTLQFIHATEVAFYPDQKVTFVGLMQGAKYAKAHFIESTANGYNLFRDKWIDAMSGKSSYTPIFLSWLDFPEYIKETLKIGVIKELDGLDKAKFIQDIGNPLYNSYEGEEELLRDKYGATYLQLQWRRWAIDDLCEGDIDKFHQEYPRDCFVGDTVVSHKDFGSLHIKDHPNVIKQGKKDVYLVTMESGYQVKCTDNHKFLTDSGYKELKDISEPIHLEQPTFNPVYKKVDIDFGVPALNTGITINEEFARFLGYFVGDGSLSGDQLSVVCDKKDKKSIDDVKYLFDKFWGGYNYREVGDKKGGIEIRKSNVRFKEIFNSLGLLRFRKCDNAPKRKVCVPDYIKFSPESVIKEFLRGVFDSDGFASWGQPRVSLFSKHIQFLRDIQYLLLGFGITSRVRTRKATSGSGYEYNANTLDLRANESRLFMEDIGFISDRKNKQESWTKNPNKNAKEIQLTDSIETIEYIGVEETYDITTSDHHFCANGLNAHNCDEAFVSSGNPVFPQHKVQANFSQSKEPIKQGDLIYTYDEGRNVKGVEFVENRKGFIKIWTEPEDIKGSFRFGAGVDVAEGLAQGDYSSFDVIDRHSFETHLSWHGHIDADLLGEEIYKVWLYLNKDCYFAIEKNNHGLTTLTKAFSLGVPLYSKESFNKGYEQRNGSDFGHVTSQKSKKHLIDTMIEWIRDDLFTDYDRNFWKECMTFVRNPRGQAQAEGKDKDPSIKNYDDRVISRGLMITCHNWMPSFTKTLKREPVARSFIRDRKKAVGRTKF